MSDAVGNKVRKLLRARLNADLSNHADVLAYIFDVLGDDVRLAQATGQADT